MGSDSNGHVVLFPFMSKGHTIPVLHLARLLVRRNFTVTIFTTPANHPFIHKSLSDLIQNNTTSNTTVSVIDLPFPENIDGIPPGIESTDKLPHISLWLSLARATQLMKPHFEQALKKLLPEITCIVTDGFLGWTLHSANKYGIPRLVFFGMSNFAMTLSKVVGETQVFKKIVQSDDEVFVIPDFPWIKLARDDFAEPFSDPEPKGPHFEFIMDCVISTSMSFGQIVNSFHDLESVYWDYWNSHCQPRSWSVGPLCLAEPLRTTRGGYYVEWLDRKLGEGKAVLYVAFGSQAEISSEQFLEIKSGLEKSEVNFLWVVRKNESELSDGFEERVKDRGLIVQEWVDQRGILGHESVQGFLSHCGWNSVLESICAKVPLLAWPMMADQPLNARLVVDEIKVGIRVETSDGSVKGFVKSEGLEKSVRELMEGTKGKEVRKNVKEVGEAAMGAVKEGGSSWHSLNLLLDELHARRRIESQRHNY
ncbi:hypothetical protein ACH5RR_014408 [Cinchona calisaya]|uniref:Glycosyltransferase n=1 Tax=Cinchona calisaya TaxID=153742 RepID=A0ABD3A2T8_9GENT